MLVGKLPELRLERRAHFRSRATDGRRVDLRFRPVAVRGDVGTAGASSGEVGSDLADAGAAPEWVSSQVRDLGVGGAFVATYRALPIGTALEVEIDLPGVDAAIAVRAEVRWLAEPGRLPDGCDPGMGLAFGPLDSEGLLAVSEYLAGDVEKVRG